VDTAVGLSGLDLGPEDLALQDEFRSWLDEHLVGEFAEHKGVGGPADDEGWDVRVRWDAELRSGGWLGIGWPREFGGRDATLTQEIVFHYEYARSEAPYRAGTNAQDLFGPMLLQFGTDAQKKRFLPPILAGEEYWGQGFSEPDAGSDLANVKTRAQFEGDEWVISGQKVWTTLATKAQWIYALCRTGEQGGRHRGLTMLMVPVDQRGVEIRPIRNLAGSSEFAEVFFDGARTSDDLVIGDIDGGWAVAMGTLGIERGVDLLPHQLAFERELQRIIDVAQANGALRSPVLRDRVMRAWIGARLLRSMCLSTLQKLAEGKEPGPEGSISKLFASTWHRDLGSLAMDILGPSADIVGEDYQLGPIQRSYLHSRAETIYGGTSEIQRNILGERVLGLPREPRATAGAGQTG
jgi:alkylation response protein AidB-like acyl-CoA dehydrogenase